MPSKIENRIEKLERGTAPARVAVVFADDDRPWPEAETVICIRFVEPGGERYDHDQSKA